MVVEKVLFSFHLKYERQRIRIKYNAIWKVEYSGSSFFFAGVAIRSDWTCRIVSRMSDVRIVMMPFPSNYCNASTCLWDNPLCRFYSSHNCRRFCLPITGFRLFRISDDFGHGASTVTKRRRRRRWSALIIGDFHLLYSNPSGDDKECLFKCSSISPF